LSSDLGIPQPKKELLTFILVLAVKLNLFFHRVYSQRVLVNLCRRFDIVLITFPAYRSTDSPSFEDKIADLVFLCLFFCSKIFPAKNGATLGAADVTNGVSSCDELSWYGFVSKCVWQIW